MQTKNATADTQTHENSGLRHLHGQDTNREQREKNGGKRAWNGDFPRGALKRQMPETAPTLGERAKKIPTDKGWDFTLWWSWRELNLSLKTA